MVDITENGTSVGPDTFDVPMDQAVEALAGALPAAAPPDGGPPSPSRPADGLPSPLGGGALTQDVFWEHFWDYLQSGDVVLADPGSGHFPMASDPAPTGSRCWIRRHGRRSAGRFPLRSAQSSRSRPPPRGGDRRRGNSPDRPGTVDHRPGRLLAPRRGVDNGGYLIEDLAIYGQHLDCDDIWVWDYAALATALDDRGRYQPLGLRVTTAAEVPDALNQAAKAQQEGRMVVLDAVFDRHDMPASMKAMHEARIAAAHQAAPAAAAQDSRS